MGVDPGNLLGSSVLEGPHVRLEPLARHHLGGLKEVAQHPDIWSWMPQRLDEAEELDVWYQEACRGVQEGTEYPFAVLERPTGRIIGSTRFMDVNRAHRGAEIGWTWYARDAWGTAVNPEAKYLLLRHAFETWGALRVQFKTDHMNLHSQRAIMKLGARYEGTLMNHRVRPDGSIRHTVLFAITDQDWPLVRVGLEGRLRGGAPPGDVPS